MVGGHVRWQMAWVNSQWSLRARSRICCRPYARTPVEVDVQPGASSPARSTRERPRATNSRPASEYAVEVEVKVQKICVGILALMDENLIPSASTGEPKVF